MLADSSKGTHNEVDHIGQVAVRQVPGCVLIDGVMRKVQGLQFFEGGLAQVVAAIAAYFIVI